MPAGGGFVVEADYLAGPEPNAEPIQPMVSLVIEEPGCTAAYLHAPNGRSLLPGNMNVFATREEAEADWWRRFDEWKEQNEKGGRK